jgi:hypothetical protein
MGTITRATIARKVRELFEDEKHYGSWSHNGNNLLPDSEYRQIAYRKAWEEVVPAYGWPGGYAIEYIAADSFVLCADCARDYLRDNADARLYAGSTDGYEGNDSADHLYCEDCNKEICRAWLRDAGHADDADLPAELLAQLRAEDAA